MATTSDRPAAEAVGIAAPATPQSCAPTIGPLPMSVTLMLVAPATTPPFGVVSQVASLRSVARASQVPLVEQQIGHRQYVAEPVAEFVIGRHPVRYARHADLAAGPGEPLHDRRLRHQEGMAISAALSPHAVRSVSATRACGYRRAPRGPHRPTRTPARRIGRLAGSRPGRWLGALPTVRATD
jgi:hypothetical protein